MARKKLEEPERWITVNGQHLPVYPGGRIGAPGQEPPKEGSKAEKKKSTKDAARATVDEVLRIRDSLDGSGKAVTSSKEVADMYKQNANPNFDFKVQEKNGEYHITATKKKSTGDLAKEHGLAYDDMGNGKWHASGRPKALKSERMNSGVEISGDEKGVQVTKWNRGGDMLPKEHYNSAEEAMKAAKDYLSEGYKDSSVDYIRESSTGKYVAGYSGDERAKKLGIADTERMFDTKEEAEAFLKSRNNPKTPKLVAGTPVDATKGSSFTRKISNAENANERVNMLKNELKKHPNDAHTSEIKARLKKAEEEFKQLKGGQQPDSGWKTAKGWETAKQQNTVNAKGTMTPGHLAVAEKKRDALWNKQDHGKLNAKEAAELKDLESRISQHYDKKKTSDSTSDIREFAGKYIASRTDGNKVYEKMFKSREEAEAFLNETKKVPNTKKSGIDLSEYRSVGNVNGYITYMKEENGRGVWVAQDQDRKNPPFSISYNQARGYEPIIRTSEEKLQHELGKMLLPPAGYTGETTSKNARYDTSRAARKPIPQSRVQVSNWEYMKAYGKAPRGSGRWAFFLPGSNEPLFFSGSFAEAKRKAIAEAAKLGFDKIIVGS